MPKKNLLVDFRAVRESLTMEQVLRHYGLFDTLRRTGDSLSGCCPIHRGSNPTQFRVSLSKNLWNCFSDCGQGGNVLDFIARLEQTTPFGAAQLAIEWFQLDPEQVYTTRDRLTGSPGRAPHPEKKIVPRSKNSPPAGSPTIEVTSATESGVPSSPSSPTTVTAAESPDIESGESPNPPLKFRLEKLRRDHPYLTQRGLTDETLATFGAGYCEKGMMAGRIAIPIHSVDGQVVAYAGRFAGDPPEGTPKYKLPAGFRKSLELFNLHRAKTEPQGVPLIIVEGYFDAMRLHQLGHRRVVALMGANLSPAQETLLVQSTQPGDRILVMLDEDPTGKAARTDIATRLAKFAYVRIHQFQRDGMQPEHLTIEELEAIQ